MAPDARVSETNPVVKTMIRRVFVCVLGAGMLLAACGRSAQNSNDLDSGILAEVRGIKAVDDHAHPVRVNNKDEKPDRDFDALPVDNMEPASDPVQLRANDPG